MNFYYWLYVRFYDLSTKHSGDTGYQNMYSCMALTLFLIINIGNFLIFLSMFFDLNFFSFEGESFKYYFLCFALVLFFLQYYYFSHNYKYKEILRDINSRDYKVNTTGGVISILLSVLCLLVLLIIGACFQ